MTWQTTLTKKCGIFRQSVCDFDVFDAFLRYTLAKKTAVFSSKSQSRMAMTTNSDLFNSLDLVQLTPRFGITKWRSNIKLNSHEKVYRPYSSHHRFLRTYICDSCFNRPRSTNCIIRSWIFCSSCGYICVYSCHKESELQYVVVIARWCNSWWKMGILYR